MDRDTTAVERPLACDYTGWDLPRLNERADELRAVRAEHGVGAMLATAAGVDPKAWADAHGIDRPAGT